MEVYGEVFTHPARSVLGARYHSKDVLFVMMTCYFDESIEDWIDKDGKPHKFTFVSGYIASIAQWERFEIDWKRYLAKYDVGALHMKHYSQSVGEFAKWKGKKWEPTRERFIRDAAEIIGAIARHGFVAMIPESVFVLVNQEYKLNEASGSPYGIVGRVCADLARNWQINTNGGDPCDIEFVFADGAKGKCGLKRAMTRLYPPLSAPIFKPAINEKPRPKFPDGRRAIVQLQAADFLAYEVRKLFADQVKIIPVRRIRQSFSALAKIPTAKKLLIDKTLRMVCKDARIESRN